MRFSIFSLFLGLFLAALPAQATVTINLTIRGAYDSTGTVTVADGTLWAIVIDDGDNTVAGLNLNPAGNGDNLHDAGTADSFFTTGQTLEIGKNLAGTTGGDIVFAMGGFNGYLGANTGTTQHALASLVLGNNGLVSNHSYVFFWFPEAIYSGASSFTTATGFSDTIAGQVGGISSLVNETSTYGKMVVPNEGAILNQGARSTGTIWNSTDFTAVTLVPEPSVLALLGLAGMFLLRRKRTN